MPIVTRHIRDDHVSQTVCQHVFLAAGATREVTMRIPYASIYKRMNTTRPSEMTMGTLVCSVFNELAQGTAAGPISASLGVYVSYPAEFSEFSVLDPERELVNRFDPDSFVPVEPHGGFFSRVANITYVAKRTIDCIDAAADTLSYLPFDKPNIAMDPVPVQQRGFPNVAQLAGTQFSSFLGDFPDMLRRPTSEDFGTTNPEMSLDFLASHPTWLTTIRVEESRVEGDVIFEMPICPCPGVLASAVSVPFQPTLLEYRTLPFQFWRGTLRLLINPVGSQFHSIRLGVITRYGRLPGTAPLADAMSQYATIIDVMNKPYEVIIPWRSPVEMMRVPHKRAADEAFFEYALGTVQIVLIQELQRVDIAAPYIFLNIFLSATEFSTDFAGNSLNALQIEHAY
jgi:hypothetical protein